MKREFLVVLCRMVISVLVCMSAFPARAQYEPYPEIGAMIDHQKAVSSILIARTATQEARALLHDDFKTSLVDFQRIEKAMEKAEKAFNIVDMLVQGGVTVLKISGTVSDIKSTCVKTNDLIETYLEKCLKRKHIVPGDTIFISSGKKMVEYILTGAEDIFNMSLTLSGLVTSRTFLCSADEVIFLLDEICDSCDRISENVKREYYRLWEYMMLRTGYWKDIPDPRAPTRIICRNAIGRWMMSAGSSNAVNY